MKNKEKLLDFISWLIKDRLDSKSDILYISEFGSSLYGLTTKNSDMDLVCIYKPSIDMLFLQDNHQNFKNIHHFSYESKENSTDKNTESDIDIKFFSIQDFIKRISYLDYQMCDILFSHTNQDKILYEHSDMRKKIFEKYEPLIDIPRKDLFLNYAKAQVKKYAPRNSTLGISKLIIEKIKDLEFEKLRFGDIFEEHVYPFLKQSKNNDLNKEYAEYYIHDGKNEGVKIFDKVFLYNIKINEFYNRMISFYNTYGARAKLAQKSLNVDWKACSHAYRALINYKTLSQNKPIIFPYVNEQHDILMQIKTGQLTWDEFEVLFSSLYEEIMNSELVKSNFCEITSKNTLLSFYKK